MFMYMIVKEIRKLWLGPNAQESCWFMGPMGLVRGPRVHLWSGQREKYQSNPRRRSRTILASKAWAPTKLTGKMRAFVFLIEVPNPPSPNTIIIQRFWASREQWQWGWVEGMMLLLLIKEQSIHQSILTKNPIERGGVASSIKHFPRVLFCHGLCCPVTFPSLLRRPQRIILIFLCPAS